MKYELIIILLLTTVLQSYSQNTIFKTEYYKNSRQIYSKYSVLINDTSIRVGEAIVYKKIDEYDYKFYNDSASQERLIMAKGQYKNNMKVGQWEFFFDNKYIYDFDNNKLLNYELQINYPLLAQELGIQGTVIIQYDIDSSLYYRNFKGLSGDSLLIKGAIRDLEKFSRTRADILKKISVVIKDCSKENVTDTLNYKIK